MLIKIRRKIIRSINALFLKLFRLFPLNKTLIVMESEGDLCDNAYALYDYICKTNIISCYKIIWLVDNIDRSTNFKNTKLIRKTFDRININGMFYLATCANYVYDHVNVLSKFSKRKNQTITYLSHGFGFKAGTLIDKSYIKTEFDTMIATGDIPAVGNAAFWKCDLSKVIKLGYPRLDYFFLNQSKVKAVLDKQFNINRYSSLILWMPTFRKSINKNLSEDYLNNETGLPLLETIDGLVKFNDFLNKNNILFILKIHHLQAELDVFERKYSNILILRDEDLAALGVQLYQFVAITDGLITDYSSISVDYMLLDKPIGYTLDDYEEYKQSRGIYPENAKELMKGYHIYSVSELESCVLEIDKGIDKYKDQRHKIIPKFFTYTDGNSSKRILDYLNIGN